MNLEQQVRANALRLVVLDVDLQLFKASWYKLRWGTPGGIDQALPCYDEALLALRSTDWPGELAALADELARCIEGFQRTLAARDVTTASAEHTRMMRSFEALREGVRPWPEPPPGSPTP